jgi:hypothetical protein
MKETGNCCLCKGHYTHWGNNPVPLKKTGRCCDTCNLSVIAARLKRVTENLKTKVKGGIEKNE